jgi:hypothetical protein
MTPHDPFIDLWQTAPKPDTQHLMRDLERANRLHHRFNRTILAILCGIGLLLVFEESTGRVATHGALSAIWILAVTLGIGWQRRARCNRTDALALDTVRLLEVMIARAKRDLFLARCLYAGVPCGAALGFLVFKPGAPAVDARLHLIQSALGVAALLAMMVTGAVLARSRRTQVEELTEKLRIIKTDL